MNEGLIEEGSTAWQGLSEGDMAKRRRVAEEMRQKLKNPNYSLSKTRLAIRNIPASVDETALKRLVIAAVRYRGGSSWPALQAAESLLVGLILG